MAINNLARVQKGTEEYEAIFPKNSTREDELFRVQEFIQLLKEQINTAEKKYTTFFPKS